MRVRLVTSSIRSAARRACVRVCGRPRAPAVLAVLALRQIRQTGERGAGLARGSLVFTAVFLVGWCAFAIWYVMTYG